jgi:Uma2 family endonuclease
MATALTFDTIADLLDHLGGIAASRVRFNPTPGTATEADLIAAANREGRLFELIDGILVEKGMSYEAGYLAGSILMLLRAFVMPRQLGLVNGPDAALRLFPGLARIPDVSFVSWERMPGGRMPREPIPSLVPNLAVEVLSPSNTVREMAIKRGHYFEAGVRLVWIVDPEARTVTVYTEPDNPLHLDASATLDGGDVLPGLAFPLADLFSELDLRAPE